LQGTLTNNRSGCHRPAAERRRVPFLCLFLPTNGHGGRGRSENDHGRRGRSESDQKTITAAEHVEKTITATSNPTQDATPRNFETAHQCFSHALLALANPYSSTFTQIRNSSVVSIQALTQISDERPLERLQQANESINKTVASIRKLTTSAAAIAASRVVIQSLLNEAAPAALEQHADLFAENDDESDKGDWEQVGSDEEIVE
jgi:hypothetical protein